MTGQVLSIKLVGTLSRLKLIGSMGLTERMLNSNEFKDFEAEMIRLSGEEKSDPNL